eukprot:Phypoly_transcript_05542.p1 GENE.Phypoly_transcript_05542~~Phypoly_transcript_05542.p1  ORF type:complete len:573 (+),score=91.72 Phypoly_transcript_05542:104-1822(+)
MMVVGRVTLLRCLIGLVVLVGLCISVSQVVYLDNGSAGHPPRPPFLRVNNPALNGQVLVGQRTMHETWAPPISHPKVLIVSMPRSGSTFMLEIFKNHPDFLPLFETTKWMRRHPRECTYHSFYDKPLESVEGRWFNDLYACDFRDYVPRLGSWGETKSGDKSQCIPGDPPSKIVVAKEIWPWGIRLDWVNQVVGQDLRVISLTRDVRGFVSSYTFIPTFNVTVVPTPAPGQLVNLNDPALKPYNFTRRKSPLYQTWRMDRVDLWTHFCLEGIEVPTFLRPRMKFIKRVMQDKFAAPHLRMASVWTIMTAVTQLHLERNLKGRYLSVSHTELSLNPHPVVDEMFDFLGKKRAPAQVHDFMDSHTREGNYTSRHSTTRNSTEAAVIYLSRLTETQIADIEAIAQGVMEPFGFIPIAKVKADLDASSYERTPKGQNQLPPPIPIFEWEKEETKTEEKSEKGGEGSKKGEESEEEEVTEEEALAAEQGMKEEAADMKEIIKEIKEQLLEEMKKEIQEEIRNELRAGIQVKMPEETKNKIKKEMEVELEIKIKQMREQVKNEIIAEITAEYDLVRKT